MSRRPPCPTPRRPLRERDPFVRLSRATVECWLALRDVRRTFTGPLQQQIAACTEGLDQLYRTLEDERARHFATPGAPVPTNTVYSCWAEFRGDDEDRVLTVLYDQDPTFVLRRWQPGEFGAGIEFESAADLATICHRMDPLRDTHVMVETLRAMPLAENSCERTFMGKPEALVTEADRREHEAWLAKLGLPGTGVRTLMVGPVKP